MARNRIQGHVDTVQMAAPVGGVVSGTPVLIGQTFGVPMETAAVGVMFTLGTSGIWDVPKQAALAITAGADVYWDAAAGEADTTNTNHHIGKAAIAAAGAGTTVRVALGLPVGTSEGLGDFAALFDADSLLKADSDDTPVVLPVAASTFVGRAAAGSIAALTVAQAKTLLSYGQAAVVDAAAATAAAPAALTSGAGTGADATTPSGAEHLLVVDDLTELRTQLAAAIVDAADMRTQLNAALARLRVTGGSGMIVD